MHARSGELQLDPANIDAAVSQFEIEQLPRHRDQGGFKGFTLAVNRGSGEMIGTSFWESEDDLHASDELGKEAREGVQQTGGGRSEIKRRDWEVVVDETA
jgi:heme-degrading monooxygenase HmoA